MRELLKEKKQACGMSMAMVLFFHLNLICFKSGHALPAREAEGQRRQLCFHVYKMGKQQTSYLPPDSNGLLFNFILYQCFGNFGCTLESSRSFKNHNAQAMLRLIK